MNHEDRYLDLLDEFSSVHPDVRFGKNVRVGRHTIIEHGCEIGDNTRICHLTAIRPNCRIGSDCLIASLCVIEDRVVMGNKVSIQPQCHVTPGTIFEDNVYVGVMCIFIETLRIKHGRDYPLLKQAPYVEYGARIGTGSIIMPNVRIGTQALIAAGSLVTHDCDPFFIYMGRPAKMIRAIPPEEHLPFRAPL